MDIHSEVNMVSMSADTAFIPLQPAEQGVIWTFKSYSLRSTFCKAIAVTDSDSSNGYGQSKLKTFWKGFTILDSFRVIFNS